MFREKRDEEERCAVMSRDRIYSKGICMYRYTYRHGGVYRCDQARYPYAEVRLSTSYDMYMYIYIYTTSLHLRFFSHVPILYSNMYKCISNKKGALVMFILLMLSCSSKHFKLIHDVAYNIISYIQL